MSSSKGNDVFSHIQGSKYFLQTLANGQVPSENHLSIRMLLQASKNILRRARSVYLSISKMTCPGQVEYFEPWFKIYTTSIHSRKVQRLDMLSTSDVFRRWVLSRPIRVHDPSLFQPPLLNFQGRHGNCCRHRHHHQSCRRHADHSAHAPPQTHSVTMETVVNFRFFFVIKSGKI